MEEFPASRYKRTLINKLVNKNPNIKEMLFTELKHDVDHNHGPLREETWRGGGVGREDRGKIDGGRGGGRKEGGGRGSGRRENIGRRDGGRREGGRGVDWREAGEGRGESGDTYRGWRGGGLGGGGGGKLDGRSKDGGNTTFISFPTLISNASRARLDRQGSEENRTLDSVVPHRRSTLQTLLTPPHLLPTPFGPQQPPFPPPPPPHRPNHFMDSHKIKENLAKVNIFFEVQIVQTLPLNRVHATL